MTGMSRSLAIGIGVYVCGVVLGYCLTAVGLVVWLRS